MSAVATKDDGYSSSPIVLFDVEVALSALYSEPRFERLRPYANGAHPALTVAGYAELLAILALRFPALDALDVQRARIDKHFSVVSITTEHAYVFAKDHKRGQEFLRTLASDPEEAERQRKHLASRLWNCSFVRMNRLRVLTYDFGLYGYIVGRGECLPSVVGAVGG